MNKIWTNIMQLLSLGEKACNIGKVIEIFDVLHCE